jgi:hypothetical protein
MGSELSLSLQSMRIRTHQPKRIRPVEPEPEEFLEEPSRLPPIEGGLIFNTRHSTSPCDVDLTCFRDGQAVARGRGGANWTGPYSGRPQLILDLLPALTDRLTGAAERTVDSYIESFRGWWRLFDKLERRHGLSPVCSVADLNDIHGQFALDSGMNRKAFGALLSLANTTRRGLRLRVLHWTSPGRVDPKRRLPPKWQFDVIRHELKHRWFQVLDRWQLADRLISNDAPLVEVGHPQHSEQCHLVSSYQYFRRAAEFRNHPCPNLDGLIDFESGLSISQFYDAGLSRKEMLQGRYPLLEDLQAPIHLCMANTGWNKAVVLAIDVTGEYIAAHPTDSSQYIMWARKEKAGGTPQETRGLFKSQAGIGFIVLTIVARTEPLRTELRKQLKGYSKQLKLALANSAPDSEPVLNLNKTVSDLQTAIRSPWLYATHHGGIACPDQRTLDKSIDDSGDHFKYSPYLRMVIRELNVRRPQDNQLAEITPGDFRDNFARVCYEASGGSVLAVKKALGHKRISSTQVYLTNQENLESHRQIYGRFWHQLWDVEIRVHKSVDPSILALGARTGTVTAEHRSRLGKWRKLMISRVEMGCTSPKNPPRRIAPHFVPDGLKNCDVQRCTLCFEHGVILPTSLPGLAMRAEELCHIRTEMSIKAWLVSTFSEELENTEVALLGFDPKEVALVRKHWAEKIRSGEHRVIDFQAPI